MLHIKQLNRKKTHFFGLTRFLSFSPLQRCMVRVTNDNSAGRLTSNKHRLPGPECAEWVSYPSGNVSGCSQSSIDKHRHTSGISRVVTSGKIILSSFLFISGKLKWPWNARACQLPVYPGCNFTSGTILYIRLTHNLPLHWIFNP